MKALKKTLLVVFLVLSSACNYMQPEPYEPEYVVESNLVANNVLPEVNLFTSVRENEDFSWDEANIGGAIIEIHLMNSTGKSEKIYPYQEKKKGIYTAENPFTVVQPSRTYELFVTIPQENNHQLWATTTVPGQFNIIAHLPDTVRYQSETVPSLTASISSEPDQNLKFLHRLDAKKPYIKNLTPYYKSQASEDSVSTYHDFADRVLEIVNQANYDQPSSQTLVIHFPWKDFAYYGPHAITVQVVDNNLYDHIRSANAQFGGSNVGPGQIYNTISHVKGGLGVFGSMATDTTKTYVKRP